MTDGIHFVLFHSLTLTNAGRATDIDDLIGRCIDPVAGAAVVIIAVGGTLVYSGVGTPSNIALGWLASGVSPLLYLKVGVTLLEGGGGGECQSILVGNRYLIVGLVYFML